MSILIDAKGDLTFIPDSIFHRFGKKTTVSSGGRTWLLSLCGKAVASSDNVSIEGLIPCPECADLFLEQEIKRMAHEQA